MLLCFLLCHILLLLPLSSAHPGGDLSKELEDRRRFLQENSPGPSHCQARFRRDFLADKEQHQKRAFSLRSEHGLDLAALGDFPDSHDHSMDYDLTDDPHDIFDKYDVCALSPDVTEGPFYVEDELDRSNITDGQPGIPLRLYIRVKDFHTCDNVRDIFVEIWHTNATGVYGGTGNTHGQTFGRGLQKTDNMGVVTFDTIFPGHYGGRAQHIHVAVHIRDLLPSGYRNVVALCAQIFFDQDLATHTRDYSPYNHNQQPFTNNSQDGLLQQEAAGSFDPYVSWVHLGEELDDGILGWITVGANMSEHRELSIADHRTDS